MLDEANAGQRGRDGGELAAHLGGGIGLGIKRVVMAWSALHPEQNAAHRFFIGWSAGRPLQTEKAGQRQAQRRQAADAEKVSPGKARAIAGTTGVKIEHGAEALGEGG